MKTMKKETSQLLEETKRLIDFVVKERLAIPYENEGKEFSLVHARWFREQLMAYVGRVEWSISEIEKSKVVLEFRSAGQCADCKRDLMEPYETGAHGDKYCTGCYRYLTSKGAHGL